MFKKEAPKHHGKGAPPAHAKAHGYRAKHHYYYYPNQGIYFDRDKGVYFWYGDGDWRMGPVLPRGVALKGSPKVRVT